MASERHIVDPSSGEVVAVPEEQFDAALSQGYKPATEQQSQQFMALDAAKSEPVLGRAKAYAEMTARFINPADIAQGVLRLAAHPAETAGAVQKLIGEGVGKLGFEEASRKMIAQGERDIAAPLPSFAPGQEVLERAGRLLEPLTTTGIETGLGISTPEAIRAREEAFPEAGWAALGLTLAGGRLAKMPLSSASRLARAAEATAEAEALTGAARQVSPLRIDNAQAYTEGIRLQTQALKATQRAQELTDKAVSSAVKSTPGAERLLRRIESLRETAGELTAPSLVSRVSPAAAISEATETGVRSLVDAAPALRSAPAVVKDIIAKGISSGVGSAVDAPFYALGQVANEDILGDHKLTSEQILASMLQAAKETAVIGGVLGAAPHALHGSVQAVEKSVNGLRSALNLDQRMPRVAALLSGASEEAALTAYQNRQRVLEGENVADLIEQAMPPAPEAPIAPVLTAKPIVREAPLPPKLVEPEPLPPLIEPVAPTMLERPTFVPSPRVPAVVAPELTQAQINKASNRFADGLRETVANVRSLMKESNALIRPADVSRTVDRIYFERAETAKQAYLDSIGGRATTPEHLKQLEAIPKEVNLTAKNEIIRLRDFTKKQIEDTLDTLPAARPTRQIAIMENIVEDLDEVLKKSLSPGEWNRAAALAKRRAYEASRKTATTQEEQAGRRLARIVGGEFRSSLENSTQWGEAAVQEAAHNAALTNLSDSLDNIEQRFFKSGPRTFRGVTKDVDSAKALKFTNGLISIESGAPTLDNASSRESLSVLRNFFDHIDAYRERVNEAALRAEYSNTGGIDNVAREAASLRKAYAEAEIEAVRQANNELAEQAFAAAKRERAQLVEERRSADEIRKAEIDVEIERIDTENLARKTQYKLEKEEYKAEVKRRAEQFEQAKVERKQLIERLSTADKREAAEISERIKKIDEENKALLSDYKSQLAEFENAINARRRQAEEQARLLRSGAPEALSDALSYGGAYAITTAAHAAGAGIPVVAGLKMLQRAGNVERAYKTLAWMERAARKTERMAHDAADAMVTGERPALGLPVAVRTIQEERRQFESNAKQVATMMADPDEMQKHVDDVPEGLEEVGPKTAQSMKMTRSTAVAVVASKLPQPPPGLPPYERANWKATDHQMREFNRTYEAATNPVSVMADMANGTVTQDQLGVMRSVYPMLYQSMQQRALKTLREKKSLSASRRRLLSVVFGINVDSQTDPSIVLPAQQAYAPAPTEQKSQQMPVSRAKALNVSGRSQQETAAWREAQTGIGAWNRQNR